MSTFCRPPVTGISIPFSDNANVEENFPTHSAYALPSLVLVKPLRPQRTSSIPLLTRHPPPQCEDNHFHCIYIPAECTFFLLLLSVAFWLEMLRMVEERHVYVLYLSPRLGSEPLLYVKAMSPLSFRLPGAEVSAFPIMKPIQHPGLDGAQCRTGARLRTHAGEPRSMERHGGAPLPMPSRLCKSP